MENIEYLEMYAEARDLVQSWWDRWVASSASSPRFQGGSDNIARDRRAHSRAGAGAGARRAHKQGHGKNRMPRSRSLEQSSDDGNYGEDADADGKSDVAMDGSEPSDLGHEADDEGNLTSTNVGSINRLADQVSSAFSERQ